MCWGILDTLVIPLAALSEVGAIQSFLIDVNVGLPRCGCSPDDAGSLAELARGAGLEVRGVMGYEGHTMLVGDRDDRARQVADSMALLERAHDAVGGPVRSAGGTGSWDLNASATELQAGSYALMDTAYAAIGLPFEQALSILATVISVNPGGWAVADCGLKALGMDHGNPSLSDGSAVWFCSDEHVVFSRPEGGSLPRVGDQVPPGSRDDTYRVQVRLVNVFTTVTDSHGAPVANRLCRLGLCEELWVFGAEVGTADTWPDQDEL